MMPRRTTKYLSITAGATTTYPPIITIFCLFGLLLLHRYATSYLSINPSGTITHRTWTGRRITTPITSINAYTYTPPHRNHRRRRLPPRPAQTLQQQRTKNSLLLPQDPQGIHHRSPPHLPAHRTPLGRHEHPRRRTHHHKSRRPPPQHHPIPAQVPQRQQPRHRSPHHPHTPQKLTLDCIRITAEAGCLSL